MKRFCILSVIVLCSVAFFGSCYGFCDCEYDGKLYVQNKVPNKKFCVAIRNSTYDADDSDLDYMTLVADGLSEGRTFVYFVDTLTQNELVATQYHSGKGHHPHAKCTGYVISFKITIYCIEDTTSFVFHKDNVSYGDNVVMSTSRGQHVTTDRDMQYLWSYLTITDSLVAHMERDTASLASFEQYYVQRDDIQNLKKNRK